MRVVLLDIELQGEPGDPKEKPYYYDAVDVLRKVRGAPLVFILSSTFTREQARLLRVVYEEQVKKKFHGVISDFGMRKDQVSSKTLVRKISDSLKPLDVLQILMLWEAVLDSAEDTTVETMFREEGRNVIKQLIRDLNGEVGKGSLGREFTLLCNRILSRFTREGTKFNALRRALENIAGQTTQLSPSNEETLTSLLMHYNPKGENILTGDIFRTRKEKAKEFAMVLNPVCDFAQRHVHQVTVAYGFRIDPEGIKKVSHPLYSRDPELAQILRGDKDSKWPTKRNGELVKARKQFAISEANRKYFDKKSRPPIRFQVLRQVPIRSGKKSNKAQICFDLQNLESLDGPIESHPMLTPKRRVTRLDSPYVDLVLQNLGTYVSRLGALGINTPD